ncbi:MAG: M28 family peptidase [Gemmatimonadota bacterium]
MNQEDSAPGAFELVQELVAGGREAGSEEARQARDRVAEFLAAQAFQVEVQRFRFSPSGLLGFPVFGAGLGWLSLLEIFLLSMPRIPAWAALLVWFPGLVALGVIAVGLGMGWYGAGGEMREDANLIATRGGAVDRWIVAHLDTKAQAHSMAGRLVAVWVTVFATLMLSIAVLARLGGPLPVPFVAAVSGLAVVAGFLAGRGRLKGASPGARDNGSGLLAALVVAERATDPRVGIVITGAEEFGLIGARYFAQQDGARLRGRDVVNFDTIDDRGPWRLVVHGAPAHPLADAVARQFAPASPRQHRLPIGIFVDSLPLARVGARAVTVARLDWETFKRVHTPLDTREGLGFESARQAGEIVARLPLD